MKLGKVQSDVLAALKRHGTWHRQCGWTWHTYSGTKRIMDSLVKKGVVRNVGDVYFPRE